MVSFILGFQVAADKFFIFFLTLFLTTLAASSIAFLFSAMFRVSGIATLFVAMSFVIQMVSWSYQRTNVHVHVFASCCIMHVHVHDIIILLAHTIVKTMLGIIIIIIIII